MAIASVSIILLLIIGTLMLRSPTTPVENAPVKEVITEEIVIKNDPPEVVKDSAGMDDSQKKIVGFIDEIGSAVTGEMPNAWDKIKSSFNWFLEFDSKYVIIIIVVIAIVVAGISGSSSASRKKNT